MITRRLEPSADLRVGCGWWINLKVLIHLDRVWRNVLFPREHHLGGDTPCEVIQLSHRMRAASKTYRGTCKGLGVGSYLTMNSSDRRWNRLLKKSRHTFHSDCLIMSLGPNPEACKHPQVAVSPRFSMNSSSIHVTMRLLMITPTI